MALSTGSTLGAYQILAPLGSGGMGEVYRARDTKLGRAVAIKVLPEAFAFDADRVARFEREAKVLASLNHPHIAALYGMELSHGRHFLIMELVEGETLAGRLQRGPLPVEDALKIANLSIQLRGRFRPTACGWPIPRKAVSTSSRSHQRAPSTRFPRKPQVIKHCGRGMAMKSSTFPAQARFDRSVSPHVPRSHSATLWRCRGYSARVWHRPPGGISTSPRTADLSVWWYQDKAQPVPLESTSSSTGSRS